MAVKVCEQCKNEFAPKKDTKGRFCSLSCYHVSMVGVPSGRKPMLGKTAWNKGKKLPHKCGPASPVWKGEEVSYRNLHRWVVRHLGQPSVCTVCKSFGSGRKMHWANISRQYKRDLSDWIRLCAKCHSAYDLNRLVLP